MPYKLCATDHNYMLRVPEGQYGITNCMSHNKLAAKSLRILTSLQFHL